jgi:hypothetical protein
MIQQLHSANTSHAAGAESIGVSENDLRSLAERREGDELLSQPQTFDAGEYQKALPKRKPTSPFRKT